MNNNHTSRTSYPHSRVLGDVLIIGSGIAGLAFAIKMAERKPDATICLFTKADKFESNTKYAQGGIAAVMDNNPMSFEQHISDTIKAGKGLCNTETVALVVKKAPKRLQELIEWGTDFDKLPDGSWKLGLEGGHSTARILHHKDQTGWAMEKALLNKMASFKNIFFYTEHFATDLIVKNNQCHGAVFIDRKSRKTLNVSAKITYLATGGSGQVFAKTTNPVIATGDGVAMAYRAGATVSNMEYYQFHPTALAVENGNPAFLVSEAVRGFGAYLVNEKGNRFVFDYHPDGELATRDTVSNAIFREMQQSGKHCVYLDCRHLDKNAFREHFPNIVKQCRFFGIDVFKDLIPVAPAAHYQCGGIEVNRKSQTSIKNLYANGECAHTGLHGANRLASNSLLEAVVFAHEAACAAAKELDTIPFQKNISKRESTYIGVLPNEEEIIGLKEKIRQLMYDFYIEKSLGLNTNIYKNHLQKLSEKTECFFSENLSEAAYELKNLASVARLIALENYKNE